MRYRALVKHIATWIEANAWPFFEKAFAPYPDMLLWNARTGMVPDHPDGLLLSGGFDIGREYLRQPVPDPSQIRDPVPERDAWEFYYLPRVLARRRPIFAICRGLQVLNVALGGTLLLDIPATTISATTMCNRSATPTARRCRSPR